MKDCNFKGFYKFSESMLCYKYSDKLEIRFSNIEIIKPKILTYKNGLPDTRGLQLAHIEKNWIFYIPSALSYDYDNPKFINILKHLERCYETL